MTITPPIIPYNTPEPTAIPRRLRILSTIQYVGAVLILIQLPLVLWCVLSVLWYMDHRTFLPPSMFVTLFRQNFDNLGGYLIWTASTTALTVYSARQMAQARRRIQSVVIAGLQCILIPLGTVLGLATMISLFTSSFKQAYAERRQTQDDLLKN
jgi:hypothetical protein